MKFGTLAAMSALTFALAACGDRSSTTTSNTVVTETPVPVETGELVAPLDRSAQIFANAIAASDATEIAASKLALEKSTSPAIKAFANQMITAHTESTDKLKAAVVGLDPPVAPNLAPTPEQEAMLTELRGKSGADFDAAFAAGQVRAHEAALATLNDYVAIGTVPALKDFATAMVPKVTAHLNMAKGLK